MSTSNSIHVVGNLTATPELRYTNSGRAVTNVRVAVNESTIVNGVRQERVQYFDVVVWNAQAENLAMTCQKGTRITVSARLQIRKANINGVDKYYTELVADEVGLALRFAYVDGEIVKNTGTGTSPEAAEAEAEASDEVTVEAAA